MENFKNLLTTKNAILFVIFFGLLILASGFIYSKSIETKDNSFNESETGIYENQLVDSIIIDETIEGETELEGNIFVSPLIEDLSSNESFTFSLEIPSDWDVDMYKKTKTEYLISLKKSDSVLTISMPTAFGPSPCNFRDSASIDPRADFHEEYTSISTSFGEVRIVKYLYDNPGLIIYDVCQQYGEGLSTGWGTLTKIGLIRYSFPSDYKDVNSLIKEMDLILQSIGVKYQS